MDQYGPVLLPNWNHCANIRPARSSADQYGSSTGNSICVALCRPSKDQYRPVQHRARDLLTCVAFCLPSKDQYRPAGLPSWDLITSMSSPSMDQCTPVPVPRCLLPPPYLLSPPPLRGTNGTNKAEAWQLWAVDCSVDQEGLYGPEMGRGLQASPLPSIDWGWWLGSRSIRGEERSSHYGLETLRYGLGRGCGC